MKKVMFFITFVIFSAFFLLSYKPFVNASFCDAGCPSCRGCPTCPGCPTKSPSPTPTPTETPEESPTPTPTETPEESPTPTATGEETGGAPFQLGGPPPPPDIEAGQVLGTTTLATTGVLEENISTLIFIIASVLISLGIRKLSSL